MTRFRITAPDQADGSPPFVLAGVGTNTVVAESEGDLQYWLEEAEDAEIGGVAIHPLADDEEGP